AIVSVKRAPAWRKASAAPALRPVRRDMEDQDLGGTCTVRTCRRGQAQAARRLTTGAHHRRTGAGPVGAAVSGRVPNRSPGPPRLPADYVAAWWRPPRRSVPPRPGDQGQPLLGLAARPDVRERSSGPA